MKLIMALSPIFTVLIAIIFSQSSVTNAATLEQVQETCKNLSRLDPNVAYDYCEKSLKTAPGIRSATTLPQIGSVSFGLNAFKTGSIINTVNTLRNTHPEWDPYVLNALYTCWDLYTKADYDLKDGVAAMNAANYGLAKSKAGDAKSKSDACEDGFKHKQGVVSPITWENNDFSQSVQISLAFFKLLNFGPV